VVKHQTSYIRVLPLIPLSRMHIYNSYMKIKQWSNIKYLTSASSPSFLSQASTRISISSRSWSIFSIIGRRAYLQYSLHIYTHIYTHMTHRRPQALVQNNTCTDAHKHSLKKRVPRHRAYFFCVFFVFFCYVHRNVSSKSHTSKEKNSSCSSLSFFVCDFFLFFWGFIE
jgi:hypothetical protein